MNPAEFIEFGITAVITLFLLSWGFYLVKQFLEEWRTNQRERRESDKRDQEERRLAEIDSRNRLIEAQVKTYSKQAETADISLDLHRKVSQSIEMLTVAGQVREKQLSNVHLEIQQQRKAFRDAIEIACDFIPDHPKLQERLRKLVIRLGDNP